MCHGAYKPKNEQLEVKERRHDNARPYKRSEKHKEKYAANYGRY